MIGEFKNILKADIGNTYETIYTAPANGACITSLLLCSTSGAGQQISVRLYDASESTFVHLIKSVSLPANSTLNALDVGKIVLEEDDYIQVKTESGTDNFDVVGSLLENING